MKRRFLYLTVLCNCYVFLTSCEDTEATPAIAAEDETEAIDDALSENENDAEEPIEETSSGETMVSLFANPEIIANDGEGSQFWGEGVTITAFAIDGSPAALIYDTQFRDKGFGVLGSRWDQIDYYVMYQGQEVRSSEKIVITFDVGALDIILIVGMMGANEGHPEGETGKWTGFNKEGLKVAEGVLGADESSLGKEVKLEENSYGKYPINIVSTERIYSLEIEATGFGYGQGGPKNVNSYDNESGNKENNSDFNIAGISFRE